MEVRLVNYRDQEFVMELDVVPAVETIFECKFPNLPQLTINKIPG